MTVTQRFAERQVEALRLLWWERDELQDRLESDPASWTAQLAVRLEWVGEYIAEVEAALRNYHYEEV